MSDNNFISYVEYEERLVRMYPHFFGNLARKHPELGINDTRLCALTLLGLNSKEIATVIGSHPENIYSARYKLWHKLGLNNADEILLYLHSLTAEA